MDGLLGGDRWSSRFSSRWLCRSERGQEGAVLPLGATSCDGPFGVGVAATVVFAAGTQGIQVVIQAMITALLIVLPVLQESVCVGRPCIITTYIIP